MGIVTTPPAILGSWQRGVDAARDVDSGTNLELKVSKRNEYCDLRLVIRLEDIDVFPKPNPVPKLKEERYSSSESRRPKIKSGAIFVCYEWHVDRN